MDPSYQFDVFTRHIPLWKEHLSRFAGQPNLHFLEIGSFEGRSSCWLLEHILTNPTSRLTCIDLFAPFTFIAAASAPVFFEPVHLNTEAQFDHNIRATGAIDRVTKLKGNSQILLRNFPLYSYDVIYIDGSHEPRDVLHDAVLCWNLLKENGLMIFDDYELSTPAFPEREPKIGIDAFLHMFAEEYELLHTGFQIIIKKTHIRDMGRTPSFTVPLTEPPR